MPDNNAINFRNVSFAYNKCTPVLDDATFAIREHDAICVVGPNGGGKSTLLNLLLGILSPDRGSISVFGRAPVAARPFIGYMPQYTAFDCKFPVNVMDVVLMGRLSHNRFGRYSREDRAAALAALEETGMADFARRTFNALSGGQRQRVLIARALAGNPRLLLLDEPTSNIDPGAQEQFYSTLKRFGGKMTMIIVSHDLGFVSGWLDGVVCVNRTVHLHPVSDITGEVIRDMYGYNVNMVRHDHCCIHTPEHRHD